MADALTIADLHKSFKLGFIPKTKEILKGISLNVEEGTIFGYLGPNGAGKTTTLKTVLGLIFPDRGDIRIFGESHLSVKARARIGFLPENPYFYDYLTAAEFLDFYGRLFGLAAAVRGERARALLRRVGLERSAGLQLRKFSRGMLQRIGLAQALINDPAFVILDEPLGGLDPIGRKEIRDLIVQFKREGKTVLLSSHILQDIEMICDRVAIIVGGRILDQGPLDRLVSEKILFTEIALSGVDPGRLAGLGDIVSVPGERVLLKVYDEDKVERVLDLVRSGPGRLHSLIPRTGTLEDLFVGMVKGR
jgi:ABC-2 type transport system ATP-binding protein